MFLKCKYFVSVRRKRGARRLAMAPFKNATNSYKETISRTKKSPKVFSQLDKVFQNPSINSVVHNTAGVFILFGITGNRSLNIF